MSDYIKRADAIEAVCKWCEHPYCKSKANCGQRIAMATLPSANAEVSDYAKWLEQLIVDAESFEWLCEETPIKEWCENTCHYSSIQAECLRQMYRFINHDAPSADAVHGWRIGKPTEQGKYMVTLDSFGHKHIDLFYYGKPLMPNRKVKGKCWYRSDDEWGDVVYDDTDILAWMPLPTPYGERAEQTENLCDTCIYDYQQEPPTDYKLPGYDEVMEKMDKLTLKGESHE